MSGASGMVKILVCDPLADEAVAALRARPGMEVVVCAAPPKGEDLLRLVSDADAILVRSQTRITAEVIAAAPRLRVVGRAGAGVDNVDLDAATRRGVLVVNAPAGNSIAAAEQTMALLLALARHLPGACASVREGRWERGKFTGVEVAGKTLAVLGLGRVGQEVARRALAFRMRVLAYDPFVPSQVARDIGAEPVELSEALAGADFLTLHLPLTERTRHLIDAAALASLRPGARLVNCARGELTDESALADAIESGRLAGAALDVFSEEPPKSDTLRRLLALPQVIATPHLGASTVEAQQRVGEEVIAKVLDYLATGVPTEAVNFPALTGEQAARLRPFLRMAGDLGAFLAQIGPSRPKRLELRFSGDLAGLDCRPLTLAAARGVLSPALEEPVGWVNALTIASERGLAVEEVVSHETGPYANLLEMRLWGERGEESSVAGTHFLPGDARIVSVDGIPIEAPLAPGHFLFFRNSDVPGVVGMIGTILGDAGVNIASMALGRHAASRTAFAMVAVDSAIPPAVLDRIRSRPQIRTVQQVTI